MNQIEKYSAQSITRESASKHIASLFVVLHSQNKGGLNDAVAAAYIEAVEDISEWAVAEAANLYRRGLRGNGRFVPQPPEFAQAARELVSQRQGSEVEREAKNRKAEWIAKQIAEQERSKAVLAGITPESRKRVLEKLRATQANIAEAQLQVEAIPPRQKSQSELNRESRWKSQARAELLKTLEKVDD